MPNAQNWSAEHPAIWQEKTGTGAAARAITLRHPTYPLTDLWSPQTGDRLITIAATYLNKVKHLLGLDSAVTVGERSFNTSGIMPLTWLPISTDGSNSPNLATSFWIQRRDPSDPSRIIDRTAILLAVQTVTDNDQARTLGSRLGIRIIAHVSKDAKVCITGATCSTDLPERLAHVPQAAQERFSPLFDIFNDERRNNLRNNVRNAAGFSDDLPLAVEGLRVRREDTELSAEIYMTAGRASELAETPSLMLTLQVPPGGQLEDAEIIEILPLFSNCADVTANLFVQDPASAEGSFTPHPYCDPGVFEPYRCRVKLPGLTPGNPTELKDDLGQVSVMQSRLAGPLTSATATAGAVNETKPEGLKLDKPDSIPHARTNAFAAASGYQHARKLFDTMRSYGLLPEHYFRRAALPLRVRYRAGVPPGPGKDGKTVNARVDYDPPDQDFNTTAVRPGPLKPLQIRYALADVQRSGSEREPLGVTADPRWSWHEYSHVLIAAATGALELPFVHSTGDAFAAILCDPDSKLAYSTPTQPEKVDASWRGATFPWVYLNRRHDRAVDDGWSWSGSYHRPARFRRRSAFLRKGYDSEQILSTTLFRLYRSLGGDTFAAPAVRQSAADYTAYLIMRAIAWLGPINWTTAETPDQFVSALIDADVATALADPPLPAFPRRVGGCAHKVVRWAFESQGLYATTDLEEVVNAPGYPPEVDIFIDDRRAAYKPAYAADPAHVAGAYTPVALDWKPVPPDSPDAPAWHATKQGIQLDDKGHVWVEVHNRGSTEAADVVVNVWHASPGADGTAPPWKKPVGTTGPMWTRLGPPSSQTVRPGVPVRFGPITGLPGGPRFILAAATCPADLANIDPPTSSASTPQPELETELPCAKGPTPIVDLVAGDNNLGLRLLRGP